MHMSEPKAKLLIVDDEPGITLILGELLKHEAEIHVANNGKEALPKILTESYDAVLSDINMPVMNGFDLLAQIRHNGIETPFVFLTGYGDKDKTLEALRLGATDFLDKPVDPETVIDVMVKAIKLGQAIKETEKETEKLYNDVSIPADAKIKLKKMKQSILMMKISHRIYTK